MDNTKELLEKAKSDESAVEELLSLYKPLISTVARKYFLVGGEIDDLVQEGMIGLYKAIKNFDATREASFKTFATICINRQVQSLIRKSTNLKNKIFFEMLDTDASESIDIPSNSENPEQNIISQQKFQYIYDEINKKLSEFEVSILQLYLDGLSYDEIATKLKIDKKSVDNG